MADRATVQVGPWPKGVNNRAQDYAVPEDALRNAVDVDLGVDGRVRRRSGYSRVLATTAPHSLWSCPVGTFFVSQGTLYRFNDNYTATAIISGLLGERIAFEYFNDVVYLSDGIVTRRLLSGVVPMLWGLPRPANAPSINSTAGTLFPGSFSAAISYVNSLGEESPLSPLSYIITNTEGGFVISNFAAPPTTEVAYIRVYFSGSGGTTLYHVADVAVGTSSYTVSERTDTGKIADTRVRMVPPACSIIRHHNGRLFMVVGNLVYYTEPFAHNWVDSVKNFWQFTSDITVLEPVEAGIFICADKTYFYRFKDPDEVTVSDVFNYGAIQNTAIRLPHNEGVMWQSLRGTVMGANDGSAKNIQEDTVAADIADSGAAVLREQDGVRKYIVSTPNSELSSLAAKSFIDAEIIRRGS